MAMKMSLGGTTCAALAMTCRSRALPPISCSTLGRFDLSRVPLPAAMMRIANRITTGYKVWRGRCRHPCYGNLSRRNSLGRGHSFPRCDGNGVDQQCQDRQREEEVPV